MCIWYIRIVWRCVTFTFIVCTDNSLEHDDVSELSWNEKVFRAAHAVSVLPHPPSLDTPSPHPFAVHTCLLLPTPLPPPPHSSLSFIRTWAFSKYKTLSILQGLFLNHSTPACLYHTHIHTHAHTYTQHMHTTCIHIHTYACTQHMHTHMHTYAHNMHTHISA